MNRVKYRQPGLLCPGSTARQQKNCNPNTLRKTGAFQTDTIRIFLHEGPPLNGDEP